MILLDAINGLADSKWSGHKNSVAKCVGLDLHSTPGLLKVQQALALNSGATVDELCRVAVNCSNGFTIWFSYTSGKIFARSSTGTWTTAYTTSPGAGSAGCLGAAEFNGRIYWATQSRVHFITVANVDGDWTGSPTLNFGTFDITDASFHPFAIVNDKLCIGDGYQIATINNANAFDSNALDIDDKYRIKCLAAQGIDLVVGTWVAATHNEAEILRWDTEAESWNISDPVPEVGVNAFIRDDNFLYAQVGRSGRIYLYDGEKLIPVTRIPGDFTNVKYGEVYPGSAAMFRGIPVFGFSNSTESANTTGNPADQGVYSMGSYSEAYDKVLDLSWVISQDDVTGVEIGAIIVTGFNLMVAWTDGTSFGVDMINWSAKYASAYFETRLLFQGDREKDKTVAEVSAFYETLPASTSVTFGYQTDHSGSYTNMTSVTDSTRNRIYARETVDRIGALQLRVQFGVSSNNAPTLEIPLAAEII